MITLNLLDIGHTFNLYYHSNLYRLQKYDIYSNYANCTMRFALFNSYPLTRA